jgi:hypothetical protein
MISSLDFHQVRRDDFCGGNRFKSFLKIGVPNYCLDTDRCANHSTVKPDRFFGAPTLLGI